MKKPLLHFFPSRPFAFIRGSIIFLKVSAPRGRVALSVKDRRLQEARRKRRGGRDGRAALPERTFRNAFAAPAAFFQHREADLAWPERSKGKKIPALSLHLCFTF
jgi:hypothetical protein